MDQASRDFHVCFYAPPFGVIPIDLAETYPLSQFETAEPLDRETLEFASDGVARYVAKSSHKEVVIYSGKGTLDVLVERKCREACQERGKELLVVSDSKPWGSGAMERLVNALTE